MDILSSKINIIESDKKYGFSSVDEWLHCLLDILSKNESLHRFYKNQDSSGKSFAPALAFLPSQTGVFLQGKDAVIDQTHDGGQGDTAEALKDVLAAFGDDVRATLLRREAPVKASALPSAPPLTFDALAERLDKAARAFLKQPTSSEAENKGAERLHALLTRNAALRKAHFADLAIEKLLPAEVVAAAMEEQRVLQDAGFETAHASLEHIEQQAQEKQQLEEELARAREELEQARTAPPAWSTLAAPPSAEEQRETLLRRIIAHFRAHPDEVFISLAALLEAHPELFEHISKGGIEQLCKFISYLAQAKRLVHAALASRSDYDVSGWTDEAREWRGLGFANTVVEGVTYRAKPVTLIVRPSHFDMVVFYSHNEIRLLGEDDTQVWIGSPNRGAEYLTLGRLVRALHVNRLPLKLTERHVLDADPVIIPRV